MATPSIQGNPTVKCADGNACVVSSQFKTTLATPRTLPLLNDSVNCGASPKFTDSCLDSRLPEDIPHLTGCLCQLQFYLLFSKIAIRAARIVSGR